MLLRRNHVAKKLKKQWDIQSVEHGGKGVSNAPTAPFVKFCTPSARRLGTAHTPTLRFLAQRPPVHARSRAPAWSALLAARRLGLPFVTTYHGVYGEGVPGKRLYNSVMARGDRVIAASRLGLCSLRPA